MNEEEILNKLIVTEKNECATELITLVTYFTKNRSQNVEWNEKIAFSLCLPHLLKNVNNILGNLLQHACKCETIFTKVITHCYLIMKEFSEVKYQTATNALQTDIGSIIYILRLLYNDNNKDNNIWCDIHNCAASILKCEYTRESDFISINSLLDITVQTTEQKQILWGCMFTLEQRKDTKRAMLVIAVHLSRIVENKIEDNSVWRIVQEGFVNDDPLTRKRALFVLKWLVQHVSCLKGDFNSDLVCFRESYQEGFWSVWKTVFLVLETLEERQLHVIKPVLSSLTDVYDACLGATIHFSWFLLILRRAMLHDCKALNKWTIEWALNIDYNQLALLHPDVFDFVFDDILIALNCTHMFNDENIHGDAPKLYTLLDTFFHNFVEHLNEDQKLTFFEMLLQLMTSGKLIDLTLVYITKAFSTLKLLKSKWSDEHITLLKSFLHCTLSFIRIEYQQVIFHNVSVFFANNCTGHFGEGLSIIARALNEGIVSVPSPCYNVWMSWISQFETSILELHAQNLQSSLVKLCTDIECIKFVIFQNLNLLEFNSPFSEIAGQLNTNPYINENKVKNVLKFVTQNLKIIDSKASSQIKFIFEFVKPISNYLALQINSSDSTLVEDVIEAFFQFVKFTKASKEIGKQYKTILENSAEYISKHMHFPNDISANDLPHLLQQLKGVQIVLEINRFLNGTKVSKFTNEIAQILKLPRSQINDSLKNNETKFMCDDFIEAIWQCFLLIDGCDIKREDLLEQFYTDIDLTAQQTQLTLFEVANHLTKLFCDRPSIVVNIINSVWNATKSAGNDRMFKVSFSRAVQTIFSPHLLKNDNEEICTRIKTFWKEIYELAERKQGVINITVEQLVQSWSEILEENNGTNYIVSYVDIFVDICTFGPIRSKSLKSYDSLISHLNTTNIYKIVPGLQTIHYQDRVVRIRLLKFLLLHAENIGEFTEIYLGKLIDFESEVSKTKFMYYPSSRLHRQKIRVWQFVLILIDLLPATFDYWDFIERLFCVLKLDNQPSVRRYLEWCVVTVYRKQPQLILSLWKQMENINEKKLTTVINVMSLSIYLVKFLNAEDFVCFAGTAIPLILPWIQAQHMTARILSQNTLKAIWDRIISDGNKELARRFQLVECCFTLTERNTSAVKHRSEAAKNFFYVKFHPIRHYTLESIFYGVLSQTELNSDEWIPIDCLEGIVLCETSALKVFDSNEERSFNKEYTSDKDVIEISNEDKQLVDLQKKIMPWRIVPPTEDQMLQSELSRKNESKTSQLILCAVLVDKIPNLGGLCRTAEIFGVSSLLLASNRYMADPGFKSLSVSSEKWMNIEQVLPIKLIEYLHKMKHLGYALVGVEQTANSKMIGEYKFPEKSILVLGNEKTGIPVDIIQILDECVEIPQVGIIRSLNVHISGAIMVWEYCKQHVL